MIGVAEFKVGDVPSPEDGMRRGIVTFGKYAGLTYEQVMANDPEYCQWQLDNMKENDETIGKFGDWLRSGDRLSKKRKQMEEKRESEPTEVKRARFIEFGKHRNKKTWGEVLDEHPDYCLTLIEMQDEKPIQGKMREFIKFVKESGVDLQSKANDKNSKRRIDFGQYENQNKTYGEVLDNDPDYCLRLVRAQESNPSSSYKVNAFIAFVKRSIKDLEVGHKDCVDAAERDEEDGVLVSTP